MIVVGLSGLAATLLNIFLIFYVLPPWYIVAALAVVSITCAIVYFERG